MELESLEGSLQDPELVLLSSRYGHVVRRALATALAGLDSRDRVLLKQYHLDGLTIDQLATLYKVNRSTAARWVIAARTSVLEETRSHLRAELSISSSEVDSMIRLVQSQLTISLREIA